MHGTRRRSMLALREDNVAGGRDHPDIGGNPGHNGGHGGSDEFDGDKDISSDGGDSEQGHSGGSHQGDGPHGGPDNGGAGDDNSTTSSIEDQTPNTTTERVPERSTATTETKTTQSLDSVTTTAAATEKVGTVESTFSSAARTTAETETVASTTSTSASLASTFSTSPALTGQTSSSLIDTETTVKTPPSSTYFAASAYSENTSSSTQVVSTTPSVSSTSTSTLSSSSESNSHPSLTPAAVAGIVVALVALLAIIAILFNFRKAPLMQRALAPLHKSREENGSYYHLEKPEATHSMTGDTLVGVSTMDAGGPNGRLPSPAAPEHTYRGIETRNVNNLTVNTTNLGPQHSRYPVSPVSQVSQALVSDISPITPSSQSNHSTGEPFTVPKPVSVPSERGMAMSIAGSEVRVVRIPPRNSRAAPTGSNSGAWRPGSSQTVSFIEPRPPSPSSMERRSIRQASMLDVNSRDYKAYHPSLGTSVREVCVGRDSIASSEVLSPDSISWPMPPSTHGGSPNRR
ncbi:hypothetical protein VMCG_10460 [Cytospora schulzeri]|uniref:Uncharacterized protein n=1 Tax=Cytospora schulzeri TaxID=448051 RepID=A0A423VC68_9PEZI|nr:hypothetical protein VMCG_10460 [Valsa malicola]